MSALLALPHLARELKDALDGYAALEQLVAPNAEEKSEARFLPVSREQLHHMLIVLNDAVTAKFERLDEALGALRQ